MAFKYMDGPWMDNCDCVGYHSPTVIFCTHPC